MGQIETGIDIKLRAEIKSDSGYRLPLDELAQILVDDVIRPEAQGDHIDKQLRRVQLTAKPTKTSQTCELADA